jgi:hypothetical protein
MVLISDIITWMLHCTVLVIGREATVDIGKLPGGWTVKERKDNMAHYKLN